MLMLLKTFKLKGAIPFGMAPFAIDIAQLQKTAQFIQG